MEHEQHTGAWDYETSDLNPFRHPFRTHEVIEVNNLPQLHSDALAAARSLRGHIRSKDLHRIPSEWTVIMKWLLAAHTDRLSRQESLNAPIDPYINSIGDELDAE